MDKYRSHPCHRGADRNTGKAVLRDRYIHDPVFPEFFGQSCRRSEYTSRIVDPLPENKYPFVLFEHLGLGLFYRVTVGERP